MTAIAIHEAPTIVCPDWCTVTQEEHVADLQNMDGFVIHWSASNGLVRHSRAAYIDNTPDPDDPPLIFVDFAASGGVELGEAERFANAILAAVKEARA